MNSQSLKPGIKKTHFGWATINMLSLDVVIGAEMSALFAAHLLHVKPGAGFWIVLPLAVWIVYTADHLVDAYRLGEQAHTVRHRFHYRHFKPMLFIIIFLTLANAILVFTMLDPRIIRFGIVVATVAGIYLLLVHFFAGRGLGVLQKEFFVAVIYVAGVWGGPAALSDFILSTNQVLLLITFFMLAIADVLVFTILDEKTDRLGHHSTLSGKYGHQFPLVLFYAVMMIIVGMSFYILLSDELPLHRIAVIIYLVMAFVLFLLIAFTKFFRKKNLYRYLAELVFWLPGLIALV